MNTKYDFSDRQIDKSNKKRLIFIERMAYLMEQFGSSDEDVNELIRWLYAKASNNKYHNETLVWHYKISVKKIKKIGKNLYHREVWEDDFYLYSYAKLLHDHIGWTEKDVLSEIIEMIYFILDKIVFPYSKKRRDIKELRIYTEYEFVDWEKQIRPSRRGRYDKRKNKKRKIKSIK